MRPDAKGKRSGEAAPRAIDVARAAGVSEATVSRTFNEPGKVRPEVRERVLAVAERVGWLPHGAGSALARRRSLMVGAIIPTLASGIFANYVTAMQRVLAEHGMTLLLGVSNHDPDQAKRDVASMLIRGVEALALVGEAYESDLFAQIQSRKVPYVVTHTYNPTSAHPTLGIDNFATFHGIARYLIGFGHRTFGMIVPPRSNNERVTARVSGVMAALSENGLRIRPAHMKEGPWSPAFGRDSLHEIFADRAQRPSAVICGNDQIAFGAMMAAREAGLEIPGDFSLTGFDDDPLSSLMQPPLTTWRVDNARLGRLTAEFLLERLAGMAPSPLRLEAEILERGSTGAAAAVRSLGSENLT
jgi:LacI family transcriptional regulator